MHIVKNRFRYLHYFHHVKNEFLELPVVILITFWFIFENFDQDKKSYSTCIWISIFTEFNFKAFLFSIVNYNIYYIRLHFLFSFVNIVCKIFQVKNKKIFMYLFINI